MTVSRHEITTDDGVTLIGYYFAANSDNRVGKTVIVAPATAVRQRFYSKFCQYLADNGYDVVSFDFRMIGESSVASLKRDDSTFKHWGTLDFPAVVAFCQTLLPGQGIRCVGHSAGGWLLAINPAQQAIEHLVAISSMSGYWGNIGKPDRYLHWFLWTLVVPVATRLFGYTPGWLGLKEDTSSAFMRTWAKWNLSADFLFADASMQAHDRSNDYCGPIDSMIVYDDNWGTPAATRDIYDRFAKADVTYHNVSARDAEQSSVGHFGFFKEKFKTSLWPLALQRLNDAVVD